LKKPMDETTTKMMLVVLTMEREGISSEIAQMYVDFQNIYFSARVLQKRLEVLKTPILEPTAIMALSVLAKGNPGRAILGMIETYEKADELKPDKINAGFICEYVYPMGFYDEEEFGKLFDARREKRTGKYDFII
jgi:hypothetical protein